MENVTLSVRGLTRSYTFLHITDCHVYVSSGDDPVNDGFCAERNAHRSWYCKDGRSPVQVFDDMTRDIIGPASADALVLTGDGVDFVSRANIDHLRRAFQQMKKDVFYVYGNHEGGHYNIRTNPRGSYPDYADLMGETPDFQVRDYGDLLLIGMDNSDHRVTAEQVEKLRAQIARNIPILLAVHAPFRTPSLTPEVLRAWSGQEGHFMFGYDPANTPEHSRALYDLVMREDNHIVAILAGHIHFAHTGEFTGGRMQYVAAPPFEGDYIRRLVLVPEK